MHLDQVVSAGLTSRARVLFLDLQLNKSVSPAELFILVSKLDSPFDFGPNEKCTVCLSNIPTAV